MLLVVSGMTTPVYNSIVAIHNYFKISYANFIVNQVNKQDFHVLSMYVHFLILKHTVL